MTESWNGLYLKAEREYAVNVLVRLAEARGYEVTFLTLQADLPILETVFRTELHGSGTTHEWYCARTLGDGWTEVAGLGNAIHPRLFFGSEIAMQLGCDAFECGFLDTVSWWYSYFELGKLADRFDSNPRRTFLALRDDFFGPDDPRMVCLKYMGLRNRNMLPFTPDLAAHFEGHPNKLVPILRSADTTLIAKAMEERWPELAIQRLSQVLIWPTFGEFAPSDVFDGVVNARLRSEPAPLDISFLINRGLAVVVLKHPKTKCGQ